MKLNEWTLLFIFHEKHDDGDDKNGIAQGRPDFIIAGDIRTHRLLSHF
jgi:hypothetical protein